MADQDERTDTGTVDPSGNEGPVINTPIERPSAPPPSGQQQTVVPNVRLAESAKELGLAEGVTVIGRKEFNLPSPEEQLGGFYVENAGILVGQFPQYKFIQKKGQTQGQNVNI